MMHGQKKNKVKENFPYILKSSLGIIMYNIYP